MSDLFKAHKEIEERFKSDTQGEGYAVKFYYWQDGKIIESENRPHILGRGFSFECKRNGDKINCINID